MKSNILKIFYKKKIKYQKKLHNSIKNLLKKMNLSLTKMKSKIKNLKIWIKSNNLIKKCLKKLKIPKIKYKKKKHLFFNKIKICNFQSLKPIKKSYNLKKLFKNSK